MADCERSSEWMSFHDADIDAFLDDPDPADVFEDALAELLGLVREPWACYRSWRNCRRSFIEEHPLADAYAERAGKLSDERLTRLSPS